MVQSERDPAADCDAARSDGRLDDDASEGPGNKALGRDDARGSLAVIGGDWRYCDGHASDGGAQVHYGHSLREL